MQQAKGERNISSLLFFFVVLSSCAYIPNRLSPPTCTPAGPHPLAQVTEFKTVEALQAAMADLTEDGDESQPMSPKQRKKLTWLPDRTEKIKSHPMGSIYGRQTRHERLWKT